MRSAILRIVSAYFSLDKMDRISFLALENFTVRSFLRISAYFRILAFFSLYGHFLQIFASFSLIYFPDDVFTTFFFPSSGNLSEKPST